MHEVTVEQVIVILRHLGIRAGDGLLVHSALQFLGRPEGGLNPAKVYFDALCVVLDIHPQSSRGTFAVPTFNYSFAKGEPYDSQTSPSQGMGIFSEYVRQQPGARRTSHPMQSLAVIGAHAADLTSRNTPSAFDPGSAFERMLELDFKLLLLGADIQAVSIIHYSEQRSQVPYRYWKNFTGQVKNLETADWDTLTYRIYVRDLEINPQLKLYSIQEILQARGQWAVQPLNYGYISTCRLRDFVAAADELLAADPWVFVSNR
ncbi:MAG: AAC(3) family N-acetyltransferase [Anaerolineales bacterium]|nr:AAC(3) family N-acetyltransferase [Anaerolineales bacterium]